MLLRRISAAFSIRARIAGGVAAVLTALLYHPAGQTLLVDSDTHARFARAPATLTVVALLAVVALSMLVHRRPRCWPLLIAGWLMWAAAGRALSLDLRTQELRGHWFILPTSTYPLRRIDPEVCAANIVPRGLWLDLEYASARETLYVGPFIPGYELAEITAPLSDCKTSALLYD
jgi:hypothetical protein